MRVHVRGTSQGRQSLLVQAKMFIVPAATTCSNVRDASSSAAMRDEEHHKSKYSGNSAGVARTFATRAEVQFGSRHQEQHFQASQTCAQQVRLHVGRRVLVGNASQVQAHWQLCCNHATFGDLARR
ncbi:hypothetical protein EDB85DRAFT_1894286 [Lactarius pseudohatsudake]|nr:hypothetical protein EDB85DRAFT_1894286 [Lactarius pseudohatsudake]